MAKLRGGFNKPKWIAEEYSSPDEASSELQDGFMDLGQSLVADSQTVEIMELRTNTFDYPSILSTSTAMFSAASGENL